MVSAYNFKSPDEGKFSEAANAFLPSHSIVPLEDEGKGSSEILINEGDSVKEGQVIAKSKNNYVHAPISGIVEQISDGIFSSGKKGLCAKIALKGELVFTGKKLEETGWAGYEAETLAYRIKEGGIVNTFDKKLPLYLQIKNISKKENLALFLRLFDEDPGILTEKFVSEKYAEKVVLGALILAKAIGAKIVVLAKLKNSEIKVDENSFANENGIKIVPVEIDSKKYPCGTKHNLVAAAKKALQSDSTGKEIAKTLGKNDFFIDSVTSLHIYEAIALGKPEINALLHVTGDCLMSAAIMNVKLGTTLRDLVKMCGGFKRNLSKIVINGMMKGISVENLDIPVTKSMKSVEFVPANEIRKQYSELCVRCGECRKICPAELWPGNLYRVLHISGRENGLLDTDSIAESSLLCLECGLCNSVCPSRLPLQQSISILKEKVNGKQRPEFE